MSFASAQVEFNNYGGRPYSLFLEYSLNILLTEDVWQWQVYRFMYKQR